jgi:RNA polymerase sigma-70 factor (ECF subfamily)
MAVDRALITAAQAGDNKAIALLLEQTQPDIRRYAQYNCRSSNDVEEAVQEVLIQIYRNIASLRTVGAFSGWLFAIVRRTCWQLARAILGNTLPLRAESIELATLSDSQLRIDLTDALQSLPERYRRVVLMRDIEEMTINEIAEALSLSREAVKGRLHRGRGMIREYLIA